MLNHIVIMGRLTRDPEQRFTQSQTAVTSFTVAVDRDFQSRDSGERQTDFINCVAWRQTADFVSKYFRKGSMIVVSGRLQIRQYQDREGNNRTAAEVVADNVYFGESRRDGERSNSDNGYNNNYNNNYSRGNYGSNSGNSSNYGGYDAPSGMNRAPAGNFQELGEDDGDLPF